MVVFRRILGVADGDLALCLAVTAATLLDPTRTRVPLGSGAPGWAGFLPLDSGAPVWAAFVALGPAVPGWVAIVAALVGALSLLGRERWPGVFVLVACGAFGLVLAAGGLLVAACVPAVVGVFGSTALRRRGIAAAGGLVVVLGAALWPAPGLVVRIVFAATWLLLLCVAALAGELLARRREEAAARSAEERLRLAREVHDVVGQSVTSVAVRSAAALHLLGDAPPEVRDALTGIRDTSRETMRELRTALGLLHGDRPGLDRLDALVAAVRDAGLTVTIVHEGRPRPLPEPVEHAAYRIVQESLTNVLRHGGPTATVTLRHGTWLTLEITDDGGPGTCVEGGGRGIDGMRARAEEAGGTLTARPSERGFTVRARLPASGRASTVTARAPASGRGFTARPPTEPR